MTPSRLVKILIGITGILAAALIAAFLMRRHDAPAAPFAGSLEQAQKITLQTGAASMDLVRDSATWVVGGGSVSYRADPGKVKSLLSTLQNIRLDDVISERPEAAADFELHPESATAISAYGPNQTRLAGGLFGKQAPDFAHLYFKFPEKPQIYLARGAVRGDLGPPDVGSWRDPAVWNITEDQVTSIRIEGPGRITSLTRSSDTWSADGKPIDAAPVHTLLGQLAHLRTDGFLEARAEKLTYGSMTLQMKDGATRRLRMGKADPATRRHPAAADPDPALFWLAEGTVTSLLQAPTRPGPGDGGQKPSSFKPK